MSFGQVELLTFVLFCGPQFGTDQKLAAVGGSQTSLLFVSVLWPEHIVLAVQVVACGICALLGQRVPIGAVPVLPPGGCSAPSHLTTLQPLLGKVPSVAGGSAPRDDGKAAS